jgi:hypothetical protein
MDVRKAIDLYNDGKYLDSHALLIAQWAAGVDRDLCGALLKLAEAMNFVTKKDWEKAKDFFLGAWRKLKEIEDNAPFIDVYSLKEEAYTAAVAAERINMGESEDFDEFYVPKIKVIA